MCHYTQQQQLKSDWPLTWLSDGIVTCRMCLVTPFCVHISQWGPIFVLQWTPPLMWIPAFKLHSTFPIMPVFFFQTMWKYISLSQSSCTLDFERMSMSVWVDAYCYVHARVLHEKKPFHCCQCVKNIIHFIKFKWSTFLRLTLATLLFGL